jgi:FKBP-type peptidyl-prolyl cis-trans isomerase SlpA
LSATTPIGPGTRVVLFFTLGLDNGDMIDSTGDRAAEFVFGDGKLLPGFEAVLMGLTKGHKETFYLEPEQGFGLVNPDNIHVLKRSDFARELLLEPGLVVSFMDQQQGELPGVVRKIFEEAVEVDFNHPLAGKVITFEVDIVSVIQVTQEIARG